MAPTQTPVSVITGFLGSGKTTLINHILTGKHGKRIAVIENEFGEVSVDDALVMQAKEEVFEMANGCVCCTVRGDLMRILRKLMRRANAFDAVLIETTGLADPAPVLQTFFMDDELREAYALDALITVVDAAHIMQHLDEEKPEGVENESVEQIAFADRIILNKLDLVTPEQATTIKARIKGINAFAEILDAKHSKVPLDQLLGIQAFSLDRILANEPDFLEDKEHEHDSSITSVGITSEGSLHMDKLNEWLRTLLTERGADLFRSKGVLSIKGTDDRFVFQGVHMLLEMTNSASGDVAPWKDGEPRLNRLVFIGRNLDRDELTRSFKACLAREP
ncbi:MAG: CobW/HypB/UreG, nucleotide-binding domain-containing protein [Monoraphidium minutum]|nr:MAG: CobW/HypB/UreG, nucleotide-binding domain-containing protein [Monoraphidium minutum]